MNTYLVPVCDLNKVWIKSIKAKSYEDAENKIMNSITTEYDLDVPIDWEDFINITTYKSLYIGEIKDIDEF